jgi:hypothetical protein
MFSEARIKEYTDKYAITLALIAADSLTPVCSSPPLCQANPFADMCQLVMLYHTTLPEM